MAIVGAFVLPHPPLIIPSVGRGRERDIQDTVDAAEEIGRRIAALKPDTIVISSPHTTLYRDYFHISPGAHARGSFARFGAPQARYEVDYDVDFARRLSVCAEEAGIPAGTDYERAPELDHATMIALHFIQHHYTDFKAVRIGLSGLSSRIHYAIGKACQEVAAETGKRVVWLGSGDLSHKLLADGPYGFAPEGPRFDERICFDFATGDLTDILDIDESFADAAAECGLRSFQMMVGALDRTRVKSELLSYEGPFGVGYGVASLTLEGEAGTDASLDRLAEFEERRTAALKKTKDAEDAYVRLARASLESWVTNHQRIKVPDGLDAEIVGRRAACFVSLKIDGRLRGCIGTLSPTKSSLAVEIIDNAISAGTRDPRFSPVRVSELKDIVYDVDVLSEPEPILSTSDLDVKRYGVIVSARDGRRGVLLPDLEGVDTVEDQIRIAADKGRIDLDFDDYQLERFEVVRHL